MLHIKFIVVVDFLQIRRSVLFLSNIIKSWIYLFLVKGKMSFARSFGEFFHQELVLPVFKHFPDEHFLRLALPRWTLLRWSLPRQTISRNHFYKQTNNWRYYSMKHFTDWHFSDQKKSWQTIFRPDTSRIGNSPSKQMPHGRFPD